MIPFSMVEDLKEIREISLRFLTRREHSRLELLNKLMIRGFSRNLAETVIEELVAQGWLCDRRFAESYARQRIRKGYGPKRVEYELRQAGINNFDLDEVVSESMGSWLVLMTQVYEKKYGDDAAITRNEWAKRSRFLLQRGFTGTMIGTLFDHLNLKFE